MSEASTHAWLDATAVNDDGTCGRCGSPVEQQTQQLIDAPRTWTTGEVVAREYLTTNQPCGCAKHSLQNGPGDVEAKPASLAEFLLARIADDEAVVKSEPRWLDPGIELQTQFGDFGDSERFMIEIGAARVLAECEAKRQIVEWHQNWPVLVEKRPEIDMSDSADMLSGPVLRMSQRIAWMTEREYRAKFGTEPPTGPILRLLAQPYADHPDFREEWRA